MYKARTYLLFPDTSDGIKKLPDAAKPFFDLPRHPAREPLLPRAPIEIANLPPQYGQMVEAEYYDLDGDFVEFLKESSEFLYRAYQDYRHDDVWLFASILHSATHRYVITIYPDDDLAVVRRRSPQDRVWIMIATAGITTLGTRKLWETTREIAMTICSDPRTSNQHHMLVWQYPKNYKVNVTKDNGHYDEVLDSLGLVAVDGIVHKKEAT